MSVKKRSVGSSHLHPPPVASRNHIGTLAFVARTFGVTSPTVSDRIYAGQLNGFWLPRSASEGWNGDKSSGQWFVILDGQYYRYLQEGLPPLPKGRR